jgi:hypothetical protein
MEDFQVIVQELLEVYDGVGEVYICFIVELIYFLW